VTPRTLAARLLDIVDAIARVRSEAAGIPLDAFKVDWRKCWLVERGIEVISEASRHLTDELKARHADSPRHADIPWRRIANAGNVLRHGYDRVAADILWSLAQDELPLLDKVCQEELVAEQAREYRDG
jgi:uncharacterized protein with HEPN domain